MNKKLMILLGLVVLKCNAAQKRPAGNDIEGRPAQRLRRDHDVYNRIINQVQADINNLSDMINNVNNRLQPNEALDLFFNRYVPQNINYPLNVLIGDEELNVQELEQDDIDELERYILEQQNLLRELLAERLEHEAYEQYHAVLTDENNRLLVDDTLEDFFARHPVQNPLLPLAALANNRALQEALDDRLDEGLDEGIQE